VVSGRTKLVYSQSKTGQEQMVKDRYKNKASTSLYFPRTRRSHNLQNPQVWDLSQKRISVVNWFFFHN